MRSTICLATALVAVSPIAISAERYFEPVPSDGYEIVYQDGVGTAIASGKSAAVAISCLPSDRKSSWAVISVKNVSDHPFNVGETSLTAKSDGKQLLVARFEDLAKRQEQQEFWDRLGTNARAYTNSQNAARAAKIETTGTYQETTDAEVRVPGGRATATGDTLGTYSSTTYGGSAAIQAKAQADEQNARMIAEMNQMHSSQRAGLDRRALRLQTVEADKAVNGQVLFYLPNRSKRSPALVELILTAGTDQFVFVFQERL